MNDVLLNILYFVLSIAVSVGGAFAAKYIKTKMDIKYRDEIAGAVITATACVQQTFVDEAKKNKAFNTPEQEKAKNMAIDKSTELLSSAAKSYLYRDRGEAEVKEYLTVLIEEAVRIQKKEI